MDKVLFNNVVTVFSVTILRTGENWMEYINGCGQKAASEVIKKCPPFSKIILEGFEIDGNFYYSVI